MENPELQNRALKFLALDSFSKPQGILTVRSGILLLLLQVNDTRVMTSSFRFQNRAFERYELHLSVLHMYVIQEQQWVL